MADLDYAAPGGKMPLESYTGKVLETSSGVGGDGNKITIICGGTADAPDETPGQTERDIHSTRRQKHGKTVCHKHTSHAARHTSYAARPYCFQHVHILHYQDRKIWKLAETTRSPTLQPVNYEEYPIL
jgi:hypothetical protein